ncbi:hypothetical protein FRC09_012579 [Ceratobasidium sp. 395]|nr:hypothetical protein FRC09_012579 [Ceratobasidium sp. 395]
MKLTALVLAAVASVSMAAAVPCTLGQMEAEQKFLKAGIHASSSGHCTEWTNPKCTSYSGIRCVTADNLIVLKKASGCDITITGGTEVGHPDHGPYTHSAGYRVDLRKNGCLTNYIHTRFKKIGNRPDGRPQWISKAGNIYCDEGNHWDALYPPSVSTR